MSVDERPLTQSLMWPVSVIDWEFAPNQRPTMAFLGRVGTFGAIAGFVPKREDGILKDRRGKRVLSKLAPLNVCIALPFTRQRQNS